MRLRRDFCLAGLSALPTTSQGWRETEAEQLSLLVKHGYEGVIAWRSWEDIRKAGLIPCGMARLRKPVDALDLATRHQALGLDFTAVHAGTGFESDAEMDEMATAILSAAEQTGHALHVETHRATMTQDIKRTLDLLIRFPELPIALDFSHWYTGHELTYGGEYYERLEKLSPVFKNVRSIQLRFGSPGRIQSPVISHAVHYTDHIVALDRCILELRSRKDNFVVSCAPELLPAKTDDGRWIAYGDHPETTDRFADALALSTLADERLRILYSSQPLPAHRKVDLCN
jgi:hypothetical protein